MVDRSIDIISSDPAYSGGISPIALDSPVELSIADLCLSPQAALEPMDLVQGGELLSMGQALQPEASMSVESVESMTILQLVEIGPVMTTNDPPESSLNTLAVVTVSRS